MMVEYPHACEHTGSGGSKQRQVASLSQRWQWHAENGGVAWAASSGVTLECSSRTRVQQRLATRWRSERQ
jgi:hypothetical protein